MSVVVLLYSKYSKGCEKLLEMMSVMDFRKICVDHEDVRKLVARDRKKYDIQKVPCVLVFFSHGVVKKYEGVDAFDWVRDTMEKMRYISQASPPPAPMPMPAPMPTPSRVEMTEVPSRPASRDTPSRLEPLFNLQKPRPPPEPIAVQPVESDDGVPDMRRAMNSAPLTIAKKPVSLEPVKEEAAPMRGIKSDRQESIMSVAQQMQKQREKEETDAAPNALQKL